MPKLLIVLLLAVPGLYAQQAPRNTFSVFLSDLAGASSGGHTRWYGNYGAALESSLTPHWSAQISVTSERHHTYPYFVDEVGFINEVTPVGFHTYPIDLTGRYHFLTDSRWKPFIGAGLRYLGRPNVDSQFRYQSHLTPEVTGGVVLQFNRFGIAFEGKQLVGDRVPYDSLFKAAAGLNWRF